MNILKNVTHTKFWLCATKFSKNILFLTPRANRGSYEFDVDVFVCVY